MTRPCGCPGLSYSRHLLDEERAARGLNPCPDRGRVRGPSKGGQPVNVSRFYLPHAIGEKARELVQAGRSGDLECALDRLLEKTT